MNRLMYLTIIVLLSSCSPKETPDPLLYLSDLIHANSVSEEVVIDRYLKDLVNQINNKSTLLKSYPDSAIYYQSLASDLSYVGEETRALEIYQTASAMNYINSFQGGEFKYGTINVLTKQSSVIMLNEAHHVPAHRSFLIKCLEELRDSNFTTVAIEALSQSDEDRFNQEGFPLQKSGTYVREPTFGNALRIAYHLGYKVYGYENQTNSNRELGQAKNLETIYKENNKVLVYAGYGHIREKSASDKYWMAALFNQITEINPLTIDQTCIASRFSPQMIVWGTEMDNLASYGRYAGYVDRQVIWNGENVTNRVKYLADIDLVKALPIPNKHLKSAVIIQLYSADEANRYSIDELVPVDQKLVINTRNKFYVPSFYDAFLLVQRNIYGQIIDQRAYP